MLLEVKARILMVDDEAGTGYALKLLLELEGYEVIVAADGDEAFRLASTDPPDCIITDLCMPKVSGLDLIRQLKSQPALARVPIIVISSAEADDLRQALELGARAVLSKPIEYERLLDCLRANALPWCGARQSGTGNALSIRLHQRDEGASAEWRQSN